MSDSVVPAAAATSMFLLTLNIVLTKDERWIRLEITRLIPVQSTTQDVGATATPITIAVSFQVMACVVERMRIGARTFALTVIITTSASAITRSLVDRGGWGFRNTDHTVATAAKTATRPRSGTSR
ncbi:hypothetical protein O7626_34095 [Micromonospora sp. WMMD1102]|nr:hypothetical protein [Micromonospora sp. WMMD1102]MDG4790885.1 hypothetical protein [Micromonospora sp. WMMD1102]